MQKNDIFIYFSIFRCKNGMNNYELLLETYHRAMLLGRVKSKGEFASLLGITGTSLSRAFAQNEKYLTPNLVAKLQKLHDEMNVENLPNLALANTDAHALNNNESVNEVNDEDEEPVRSLPLIPIDAVAGYNGIDETGVRLSECPKYLVPDFINAQAEFLIRVSGSSMYPKYSSGDILACRKVQEVTFLQWGKVYVIDSQQGIMVKRLFDDAEHSECIICKSDNENYPPFSLPQNEIRSLSIVVGVIRME